jgi:hypothetical protein
MTCSFASGCHWSLPLVFRRRAGYLRDQKRARRVNHPPPMTTPKRPDSLGEMSDVSEGRGSGMSLLGRR